MFDKKRTKTELENEMIKEIYTFLLNNEEELGLDICDNCGCSNSANIYKIACEVSTTIYHFLKCKKILKDTLTKINQAVQKVRDGKVRLF